MKLPASAGDGRDGGSTPGSGRSLVKGTAPHCSLLAWRSPRTEAPGGLRPTGSPRVGHDRARTPEAEESDASPGAQPFPQGLTRTWALFLPDAPCNLWDTSYPAGQCTWARGSGRDKTRRLGGRGTPRNRSSASLTCAASTRPARPAARRGSGPAAALRREASATPAALGSPKAPPLGAPIS